MTDSDVIIHNPTPFRATRVESKGLNVLILRRLKKARRNFSGQLCVWELEYRWLSQMDEDLCCVKGQDFTLYPNSEVNPDMWLFDQFDLF